MGVGTGVLAVVMGAGKQRRSMECTLTNGANGLNQSSTAVSLHIYDGLRVD